MVTVHCSGRWSMHGCVADLLLDPSAQGLSPCMGKPQLRSVEVATLWNCTAGRPIADSYSAAPLASGPWLWLSLLCFGSSHNCLKHNGESINVVIVTLSEVHGKLQRRICCTPTAPATVVLVQGPPAAGKCFIEQPFNCLNTRVCQKTPHPQTPPSPCL